MAPKTLETLQATEIALWNAAGNAVWEPQFDRLRCEALRAAAAYAGKRYLAAFRAAHGLPPRP